MAQYRKDTNNFLNDGKTIFETIMLADKYGNVVGGANPTGTAVDAFGRARSSQPFTLFDSFHRYQDNGKINSANSATGTYTYDVNSSTISMNVDTTSGAYTKRESSRVFAYQPGKSLLVLQSYIFNAAKVGLTQRYGYFNDSNGIFLELANNNLSFVVRSSSTGVLVEERVLQSNWNVDKLDGTGPSKIILDMSKGQVQFIDIEWLGLGSVRCGFIINGSFVHAHTFHHANSILTTYMTTACLPVRAEIFNTATTSSNSSLKIVCTSVISEGGYEINGKSRTYGLNPNSGRSLTTPGTFYPVVAIRINPSKPDSIVVPKSINILPLSNDTYRWKIVTGSTLTGATWANVSSDSSVQYQSNTSATMNTDGIDLDSGYFGSTNQSSSVVALTTNEIFKYQLERNSFANTCTPFILGITSQSGASSVAASLTWQEIT